jgi:hypothetical protein
MPARSPAAGADSAPQGRERVIDDGVCHEAAAQDGSRVGHQAGAIRAEVKHRGQLVPAELPAERLEREKVVYCRYRSIIPATGSRAGRDA